MIQERIYVRVQLVTGSEIRKVVWRVSGLPEWKVGRKFSFGQKFMFFWQDRLFLIFEGVVKVIKFL